MAQRARETAGGGPSGVELVRHRLVEHEVWYRYPTLVGLGLGGIEGGSLIQGVATMLRTVLGGPRAGEMGGGCEGALRARGSR